MKAVYHTEVHFELTLKTGETVKDYNKYYTTYYHYSYGELPETSVDEYNNSDTVFEDLRRILGYNTDYPSEKTIFTKRNFINDYNFNQRIYEDELLSFKITKKYIPHKNLSTKELHEKLTFKDYSQLVFDREQELKYELLFTKEEN